MKSFLIAMFVFTLTMSTGISAVYAEANLDVLSTRGVITDIRESSIVVKGQGFYDEIVLNISRSTYLIDGISGAIIDESALKINDQVTVYYGGAVTRSMPPRGNAVAVLVGDGIEMGTYFKVKSVEPYNEGIRMLNTNNSQYVSIKNGILKNPSRIKPGSEVITWYKISTMSMPGQASSNEVMYLSDKASVRVHLGAGTIVANEKELTENYHKNANGKILLPLRSIVEALGYEIEWSNARNSVDLKKGEMSVHVSFSSDKMDNTYYSKAGNKIVLSEIPELINGVTYVPVDFVTKVLGEPVQIINTHI